MSLSVLLSNDDGHFAQGILCLYETLKDIADVKIVAPLEERSTTGHTLSLSSPLRVERINSFTYGCSGYPADCVFWALNHLYKDNPPDLVISGINKGANLAQDIYYSGTCAAAREAIIHKVPAIAVSTVIDFAAHHENPDLEIQYQTAANFIAKIVKSKFFKSISDYTMLNINVPDRNDDGISGYEWSSPGIRHYSKDIHERVDMRGQKYYWIGGHYHGYEAIEGTDCHIVEQNKIAVSALNLLSNPVDMSSQWKTQIDQHL